MFLTEIYSKEGLLFLQGEKESILNDQTTVKLVIQKRNTDITYSIPVFQEKGSYWQAILNFNKEEFPKGVWDYYLLDENNKKHRLKVTDSKLSNNVSLLYKNLEETREMTCYVTKYGSFSTKSKTPTIKVSNFKGNVAGASSVNITGKIERNKYINMSNPDDILLVIKRRNHSDTIVINDTKIISDENLYLNAEVNYQDILIEQKSDRWDVYLQIPLNSEIYLFRVELISSEKLQYSTCIEFVDSEVFHFYFYSTINNNLSIALQRLKIERNVLKYSTENNQIYFKGYAYFQLVNYNKKDTLKRSIIIRKRHSEKSLKIPLESKKDLKIQEDEFDYCFSNFEVTIPLLKILSMQDSKSDIFDFYIELQYKGTTKERKLGSQDFDYFVDDVLQVNTLKMNSNFYKSYLLYTPGGNFKLEAYSLSRTKLWYIKYGQKLDRLLFSNKDVWLIGERPDTAQDTGYHFFKYCRENYPEKPIYYVIQEDSPDLKNIKHLGNVIFHGSLKHFRIAAIAKKFIGSHDLEYILPTRSIDWLNYQTHQRVFLQHGILGRKRVDYFKKLYKYPFNLLCVSSKSEYELVTKKMGYSSNEVKITGLSRFDHLKHRDEGNIISIIPTWRDWIKIEDDFIQSTYFNKYKELLLDEELHLLLKRYKVKLNFYLHYRMQEFSNHFKQLESDYVQIIEFGERSVQDLLKTSKLLITDYSSVSFDFTYMGKPVIFYHFDFNTFFKNGILRPVEETFLGEIVTTKEELISHLSKHFKNGFKEKEEINKKKGLIFTYIDKENNKRIYNAITKQNEKGNTNS
ncbi:hypothetical protein DTX80_13240 [Bacilli bacterium]|nr:hypothetical protein DEJ64_13410 [Bacilli bacterium]PZD85244.1 hypothetical protein DEJ60_12825 [Bacilli bacterium]PZD88141.1 hypothetical protein DEJ66_13340 [Bacilli bacterium]RCO05096.1 hypothetical protein DTX80_13240 [Bacilli bacterium]RCO10885.1 hypothetical protein DTX79_02055 [Bacilli bacterium]